MVPPEDPFWIDRDDDSVIIGVDPVPMRDDVGLGAIFANELQGRTLSRRAVDHGGVTVEELRSLYDDWKAAREKPARTAKTSV